MKPKLEDRKFFYPIIYLLLIVISFLPPIATRPYSPREIRMVIMQALQYAIPPNLHWWGWALHVATILLILVIALKVSGRDAWFSLYFGFHHIIIACAQSTARTPDYGSVVLLGPLVANLLLGLMWISTIGSRMLEASFQDIPGWRWFLFPLALLMFWSPLALDGQRVIPNFDPLLLLASPDYALAYCFMTPVLLFLLILFFPRVPIFAFRVTAFNGLLYGLFNLTHWFDPDALWLGVLHLPLLIFSLLALILSYKKDLLAQPN